MREGEIDHRNAETQNPLSSIAAPILPPRPAAVVSARCSSKHHQTMNEERTPLLQSPHEPSEAAPVAFREELAVLFRSFLPISAGYALQNSLVRRPLPNQRSAPLLTFPWLQHAVSVVVVGRMGARELSAAAFACTSLFDSRRRSLIPSCELQTCSRWCPDGAWRWEAPRRLFAPLLCSLSTFLLIRASHKGHPRLGRLLQPGREEDGRRAYLPTLPRRPRRPFPPVGGCLDLRRACPAPSRTERNSRSRHAELPPRPAPRSAGVHLVRSGQEVPPGSKFVFVFSPSSFLLSADSSRRSGIMDASTLVLAIVSPLNVALNYLFVYQTSLGFLGAPLATSLSYWLSLLLLVGTSKRFFLVHLPSKLIPFSFNQATRDSSRGASAGSRGLPSPSGVSVPSSHLQCPVFSMSQQNGSSALFLLLLFLNFPHAVLFFAGWLLRSSPWLQDVSVNGLWRFKV